MTVTVQTLVAVALQLCPWQPDPVPPLTILPNAQYEAVAGRYGHPTHNSGAFVVMEPPYHIYMRERAASDRLLCHEWRHVVEPEWAHE